MLKKNRFIKRICEIKCSANKYIKSAEGIEQFFKVDRE